MKFFPATVLDFETTDLPKWSAPWDQYDQPRIIQVSAGWIEEHNPEIRKIFTTLIYPEHWHAIAESAQNAHGISIERCREEGQPIRQVLESLKLHFLNADCPFMAAYGVDFDYRMLWSELARLGMEQLPEHIQLVDIKEPATEACKLAPSSKMSASGRQWSKAPKLREAVRTLLGREPTKEHDAEGDTRDAIELYRLLARRNLLKVHPRKHSPAPAETKSQIDLPI